MKILIGLFLIIGLVGCSIDANGLDGNYVKDESGNVYKVVPRLGDLSYLEKIDIDKMKIVQEFANAK